MMRSEHKNRFDNISSLVNEMAQAHTRFDSIVLELEIKKVARKRKGDNVNQNGVRRMDNGF